ELGFNVDFAPVADVASNPDNQVIGSRSFGSDAGLVSQMVAREVQGMQEQGVSASLKHFPGHGDTSEDSHAEMAVSKKTADELRNMEFLPFKAGIEAGVDMVMIGHISVPAITGSDIPASLSEQIITGCLREELGYQGIVVTDSMSMGAIVNTYTSADAAVRALQAGCDMLLMPQDFQAARQAVLDAVKDSVLSEERLDESLRRIFRVKLRQQ
ncbi:MAG: beta-N-acetylhexosaminidase, partial [Lachnospiraceae bacterium]|nr:beta-N-acetylhexosaminidase [Lachnospiraceae bacterium]